jgi:hypothetical protein
MGSTCGEKIKNFLDKKTVKKTLYPFTFSSDFDLLPETELLNDVVQKIKEINHPLLEMF